MQESRLMLITCKQVVATLESFNEVFSIYFLVTVAVYDRLKTRQVNKNTNSNRAMFRHRSF